MHKKNKKVQKKRNKNITFIYALCAMGIVIILVALIDDNSLDSMGSSAFSGAKVTDGNSFQPTNSKKDMPGKLTWGRDF